MKAGLLRPEVIGATDPRPDYLRRCPTEIPPTDEELILWARWFIGIVAVTALALGLGWVLVRWLRG